MSSPTSIGPVEPSDFDASALAAVVAAAAEADGAEPLNEAALLALRHHGLGGLDVVSPPARTGSPGCTARPTIPR